MAGISEPVSSSSTSLPAPRAASVAASAAFRSALEMAWYSSSLRPMRIPLARVRDVDQASPLVPPVELGRPSQGPQALLRGGARHDAARAQDVAAALPCTLDTGTRLLLDLVRSFPDEGQGVDSAHQRNTVADDTARLPGLHLAERIQRTDAVEPQRDEILEDRRHVPADVTVDPHARVVAVDLVADRLHV